MIFCYIISITATKKNLLLYSSTRAFLFPTNGVDKEASHGVVCERMLGGMIMQAWVHSSDMVICHLSSHWSS